MSERDAITYPPADAHLLRQLVAQGVARRLGVAQEHGVVRLVEDWVVGASVPNTHRALEDDAMLRLPDLRCDARAGPSGSCRPASTHRALEDDRLLFFQSTSMTGMPAIAEFGSSCAPEFTVSFAPMTIATSVSGNRG